MNPKGKASEVIYNECKSSEIKTKIRRFSNMMQRLSANQEEESHEDEEDENEEMMI